MGLNNIQHTYIRMYVHMYIHTYIQPLRVQHIVCPARPKSVSSLKHLKIPVDLSGQCELNGVMSNLLNHSGLFKMHVFVSMHPDRVTLIEGTCVMYQWCLQCEGAVGLSVGCINPIRSSP